MIRPFRGFPRRLFLLPSLVLAAIVFSQTPASALQLTLNWGDTSTNEDGFKVERKAGTTGTFAQLATVRANVVSYADATVTGGASYCYRVRAYNTAGDSAYSNEACGAASADTQSPIVSITAPANEATVSGSVTASASATDNVGVVGIQFKVDGVNIGGEDTSAPYSFSWNTTTTSNGAHSLTAIARDAAGNSATSTAITVTVNNPPPPPPDPNGLVAAYSFNEGNGATTADVSGNSNTGAISGAAWTTSGKFGSALSFDGVNDWVTVNDTASLDLTTGITLEAWIYPTALNGGTTNGWRTVILKEAGGTASYDLYANQDTNQPSSYLSIGGADRGVVGPSQLPLNTWTYLVATYDGAQQRLFVNGAQVAAQAQTGSALLSTGALRIGGNSVWGEYFQGLIDNVRIYNRALTATEIQANMTIPVGTPPPPPPANYTLTITKAGTGNGVITATGINCGSDCSESYTANTVVALTATPTTGSTFAGWSGDADCSDGSVTMAAAKTCTATFNLQTSTLTIAKAGTGSGTVTSSPSGINCGSTCSSSYSSGTVVTLSAVPATGSTFAGWSGGGCSGTGTCTVTVSAATSVTATFNLMPPTTYSLSINKTGTGSGTVTSSPAGVNCGSTCSASYTSGTVVTLTASSATGSAFSGWSGACSGTGSCTVTMSAARAVTATFNLLTSTLTINKAGTGSGTVTSSPVGISCGSDCSEPYPNGTTVTLTAAPSTGSTFTGWSGSCSGSGTCTTTVSAATTVTATFASQMNVKIGVFSPSTGKWSLDLNGNGRLDDCASGGCPTFGQQGNLPVVGDWLGNGVVQIGVFDPATRTWKLDRNANDQWEGCTIDLCFGPIWQSNDLPVVGRWKSGVTKDLLGIYRPNKRYWRLDLNGNGAWESCSSDGCWSFGSLSGLPVVGDWTGTKTTKLGIFDSATGQWKLDRNGNGNWDGCTTDLCLGPFGLSSDKPVVGDWNGTGTAKIGTFDPTTGLWELDLNGNGVFDGCNVDTCLGPFGQSGDVPVVGKW